MMSKGKEYRRAHIGSRAAAWPLHFATAIFARPASSSAADSPAAGHHDARALPDVAHVGERVRVQEQQVGPYYSVQAFT
jgi:hypothetical protein